ncbi:MAG: Hpt domain-containing protein [Rhizobiaceae bacterium]|nr:Hpt domain-containing protein [Rhizobiaceae bacterium]
MVALNATPVAEPFIKARKAPIDLVYLSTLTMGDAALEAEILGMFASQLPAYIGSIQQCSAASDRKRALHTLKGAARSVGAKRLSELAAMLENEPSSPLNDLVGEADRVGEFIQSVSA